MTTPETFEKVITLNVNIQNDYLPGGAVAVPHGDEVIEPLNRLNSWTRDQKIETKHRNPEHLGYVLFCTDVHAADDTFGNLPRHCLALRAGAAFPDNLGIEYGDTIANVHLGHEEEGNTPWDGGFSGGPLYQMGDGRYTLEVNSIKLALQEMVGVYSTQRSRVAVLIGGLSTDAYIKTTVLEALSASSDMEEVMGRIPRTRLEFRPGLGRIEVPGAEPLANPLGIFVIQDAVRAYRPGSGEKRELGIMRDAGATLTTVDDVISGKAFTLKGAIK